MSKTNRPLNERGANSSNSRSSTNLQSRPKLNTQPVLQRMLQDQMDLDAYTKTPSKKSHRNLYLTLIIIALLTFIATIGGNIVDLATGGDGHNSWYGDRGVYNRLFGNSSTNSNRAENNENLANKLQANKKVISTAVSGSVNLPTETRIINPPKSDKATKPLPAKSYQVKDFVTKNEKIKCSISDTLTCIILDFYGDLGQPTGHAVKIQLGSDGVLPAEDAGIEKKYTAPYSISKGSTATYGKYACTATSDSSLDCWNLETGKGIKLSQTTATAYKTVYVNNPVDNGGSKTNSNSGSSDSHKKDSQNKKDPNKDQSH